MKNAGLTKQDLKDEKKMQFVLNSFQSVQTSKK